MNVGVYLLDNWVAISAVLGPIASYAVGRKTRMNEDSLSKNQIQSGELVNVQDALGIYRGMLNDLKSKLDDVNKAYEVLESKLSAAEFKEAAYIEKEIAQSRKIASLDKENKYLMEKLRTCEFDCKQKLI